MYICDKCGARILDTSKFCPQCGDPVTEDDIITDASLNTGVSVVKISFGYSSSPNYAIAIDICKKIPSYQQSGEGNKVFHVITLPITEIELLINIFELVGSWKSSKMLVDGHSSTKKDLVYKGPGCFRNRQKSFNPEQYCFGERWFEANIWGCKRLNMPINDYGGGCFSCGNFNRYGVWVLDKVKIKHELELGIQENQHCPVLNRAAIMETLDKLPENIDPKTDDNWVYKTTQLFKDGEYTNIATGIEPVINKVDTYVIGTYKPIWESEEENLVTTETQKNKQSTKNLPVLPTTPQKATQQPESNSIWVFLWAFIGIITAICAGIVMSSK